MSNFPIFHPAISLRKIIEKTGMTQQEVALRLNMSEKHLSEILNEKKSVTPETALKLEQVFGGKASFWINLQSRFDEAKARIEQNQNLALQIQLLDRFKDCYKDLVELGFCKKTRDKIEQISELLSFFSITSLHNAGAVSKVAFRKSSKQVVSDESVAAWLRAGELIAERSAVSQFDKNKLANSIASFRDATLNPLTFQEELARLGAEIGIKFVFVTHFKHAPVSGATRWLNGTPLIQLSDMGKKYDRVVFTLFHELGHVLLHSGESFFDEKVGEADAVQKEKEADEFAQATLIPEESGFMTKINDLRTNENRVTEFADSIGIHPSIVAGRIQRETGNYSILHNLLIKSQ